MYRAVVRSIVITMVFCALTYPAIGPAQVAPTNTAVIIGSISDSTGGPVARAQVFLKGPKKASTVTDLRGFFVFVGVPFGNYVLSVSASGLGTATRNLPIDGDTNVAIQYQSGQSVSLNKLKTIAQTSTFASVRFNVAPTSVTRVSPADNAFEGDTSWRTILEQIPGVSRGGDIYGISVFSSMPDAPFDSVEVAINGVLPSETATLLDDMPLLGTSIGLEGVGGATDLSVYPLNGFGSADIVRGPAASAPSIVDSIGGSFLLHAPAPVTADHFVLSTSTDPYGGIVSNAQAAVRFGKLSVVATYGVNDSPGPVNGGVLAGNLPSVGGPLTVDGSAFVPYTPACPSGLTCEYGNLVAPGYAPGADARYGTPSSLLACCADYSSAWSQHGGSLALAYQFSPKINVEAFYAGQSENMWSPSGRCMYVFMPPTGYAGAVPAGDYNSFYFADQLSPVLLSQSSSLTEEKITAQVGSGILTLAALQNRTFGSLDSSIPGSQTLQLYGGGCIASATTSPGCPTGYTSIVFNGGTYATTYNPALTVLSTISNNRDVLMNYQTPLGEDLHAGASLVRSYYNSPTGPTYAVGQPYNLCFPCVTIPQNDFEATNELRFFAGGNLSEKTSVDLSMYFLNVDYHVENPNDPTGNTYVDQHYSYAAPRLGFVWRPTPTVALRASAGGGFAEPPLQDFAGTSGAPALGTGYYASTLTNPNLQPEKSFAVDIGSDIRLPHDTVLSLDVYRANLFGQLYYSTALSGVYLGLPLFTTQYGNLGESRYEGVLADFRHDVPHGTYWSFSGGLTRGYLVSIPSAAYSDASGSCNFATATTPDTLPCPNLDIVPGINFNGRFTSIAIPYAQALGTVGYRWKPGMSVAVTGTYYGNNNTYYRPAFVELDSEVQYPVGREALLFVDFKNITGIYDGIYQTESPANMIGVPTIAGPPDNEFGEEYGPRTVVLTLQIHK